MRVRVQGVVTGVDRVIRVFPTILPYPNPYTISTVYMCLDVTVKFLPSVLGSATGRCPIFIE